MEMKGPVKSTSLNLWILILANFSLYDDDNIFTHYFIVQMNLSYLNMLGKFILMACQRK